MESPLSRTKELSFPYIVAYVVDVGVVAKKSRVFDTTVMVFDTTKSAFDRGGHGDHRARHDGHRVRPDDHRAGHDDHRRRSCRTRRRSCSIQWWSCSTIRRPCSTRRRSRRRPCTTTSRTRRRACSTRTAVFDPTTIVFDTTTRVFDTTRIVFDTTTIMFNTMMTVSDTTTIVFDTTTSVSDTTTIVFNMTTSASDTTTIVFNTTTIVFDTTTTVSTIVFDTTTTAVKVNELSMSGRDMCLVERRSDGRLDIVVGGRVEDVVAWREVEAKVVSIRDAIGVSLVENSGFVRMTCISVFAETARQLAFGSPISVLNGRNGGIVPRSRVELDVEQDDELVGRRVRHDSDTTTPQCRSRVEFDDTGGRRGTAVEFDTTMKRRRAGGLRPASVALCSCLFLFSSAVVFARWQSNDCFLACAFSSVATSWSTWIVRGNQANDVLVLVPGAWNSLRKHRRGHQRLVWGSGDTPGSKGHRTPVLGGAPSTGTPSANVRGSGPDSAVLITGGAAGREEEATSRQGKSTMDIVSRRRRSGETSVAGVGNEVLVVDHKDRCWMLDWVGGIEEPSGGLVLYVVIKDNIVPIGDVVKWSGGNSQFSMLELMMFLNARGERMANFKRVALRWAKHAEYGKKLYDIFNPPGTEKLMLPDLRAVFTFFDKNVVARHEPVVHASDRIFEPISVFSSSLEAAPSSKPIIIGARPPPSLWTTVVAEATPSSKPIIIGACPTPSLRTTVAATRVPKSGQIGEKGPCRRQIMPSAPVKRRPTSTKEPVSLVRPSRYELIIPAGSHYFRDDDEENSKEDWERDEEREEYEEGGGEEEVESEHTISERGGPGELEGRLGVEYEDEGQEEETTGEGGYADVHWSSKRTQLLASGHGHWEADPGRGEMHREVGVEPLHADAVRLPEKKRKNRQERRSVLDSKKTKQKGGAKQEEGKRKLKMLAVEEVVQRTRKAEEAIKKKWQLRKKAAKGGVMEKTSVFPPDQPQSDEDTLGKTFTRPPGLQILPPGNSSGHLSKGFSLEFDENGKQRPEMQFISVKFDRILDIPDEEFRYNQRFLDQELIGDLYKTMVESGEAAIKERTTGAVGVNVCALYEKRVLLLIGREE
ncbi:hypothetical protein CBR_g23701 [Chara braunii]|uniref:Uncharacterized protein n=1 Tax=Chara braunii TaxID=69332 RepID=A0A388L4X8_CHABU|nr:hypothetical protein CBR_g23701 [Chara braunii]|eukprot:GBG77370.1 hypothetical protein CBR_g23701 [Chara braunii]